jgi:hypothetical protein
LPLTAADYQLQPADGCCDSGGYDIAPAIVAQLEDSQVLDGTSVTPVNECCEAKDGFSHTHLAGPQGSETVTWHLVADD